MVDEEAEGFRRVAMVEELDGVVRRQDGSISFFLDIFPIGFLGLDDGIIVLALVVEHGVVIEALRLALHVPFADNAGLVAMLLQDFREKSLRRVDACPQLPLSVLVAVESGHQAGAAGCRERIFDKCLAEKHPLGGEAVEVGRRGQLSERVSVGADGLERMVVCHNVNNVQRFLLSRILLLPAACRQ